jgi:hypothetical protein
MPPAPIFNYPSDNKLNIFLLAKTCLGSDLFLLGNNSSCFPQDLSK